MSFLRALSYQFHSWKASTLELWDALFWDSKVNPNVSNSISKGTQFFFYLSLAVLFEFLGSFFLIFAGSLFRVEPYNFCMSFSWWFWMFLYWFLFPEHTVWWFHRQCLHIYPSKWIYRFSLEVNFWEMSFLVLQLKQSYPEWVSMDSFEGVLEV